MDWKVHVVVGVLLAGLFLFLITEMNINFDLVLFPFVLFFALLPDIDHKNSMITWLMLSAFALCTFFGIVFQNSFFIFGGAAGIVLVIIAVLWFKHRGFTHSLLFGMFVCAPVFYFFGGVAFLMCFVAFWSHLLMDFIPLKVV